MSEKLADKITLLIHTQCSSLSELLCLWHYYGQDSANSHRVLAGGWKYKLRELLEKD